MKGNKDRTSLLLACGIIAGPIYILVGGAQILTREGFDMTWHPLSMMNLGDLGWIQITNFIASGFLVLPGQLKSHLAQPPRRELPGDRH